MKKNEDGYLTFDEMETSRILAEVEREKEQKLWEIEQILKGMGD